MSKWNYDTAGIPDSEFIRGKVPMTKEEVRALIVSKLRLKSNFNVLDIGAGTGSVTIEVAHQCKNGVVKAIERNPDGIDLIKKNAEKFDVNNIEIVEGKALEHLDDIEKFDRIFIGGSGGQLEDILDIANERMKEDCIIVITSITIETLYKSTKKLEDLGMDVEVTSIGVSKNRRVGSYNLLEALNSIYIITGRKK